MESVLLDFYTWERIEAQEAPKNGPYVLVLDLGQNAAMSAAAYWMQTGRLEALAVFPVYPDLQERGRRDGVVRLYVECHNRGELLTAEQRVSDVGSLLREVRWGDPAAIVCDRWREAELRQALEVVSFPS